MKSRNLKKILNDNNINSQNILASDLTIFNTSKTKFDNN
jgi:hypothetical protein